MGLFDSILGGSDNSSFNKQDAVIAVLYLVVAADGEISKEEVESLIAISNRMELLRSQTAAEFNASIDKVKRVLKKNTYVETLQLATQAIPQNLRDTVFALSADLIFADGTVDENETALLEEIQNLLDVSDDLAMKIVEVLQIKNKG